MATTVYGSADGAHVVIRGDLEGRLMAALRNMPDTIAGRLLEAAEEVVEDAKKSAPEKSGRYRMSLRSYVKISSRHITVGAAAGGSGVKYAHFVRWGKKGPGPRGKSAWQEGVRKPLIARTRPVIAEIGKQLAADLGGRR